MGEHRFSIDINDQSNKYLMEAYFSSVAFPGSTDGVDLTRETILEFLTNNEVIHGILEESLERILDQGYAQKELIAVGTPPQAGEDARFEVLVPPEVLAYETFASSELLNLEVYEFPDYKIPTVKPNTPLLRKIAATPGYNGTNVLGKPVAATRGQDKSFPKAKNATVSPEDKDILIATTEGYPFINDYFVSVEHIHMVDQDVAQSLEFDGIVLIRGSIKDQLRVVATSDVVILGATEAVVVESGRNIVISGGVKGRDMAVMKSRGDVISRFVEMSTLESGGNIYAKSIIQTFAFALGNIYADRIMGGDVRGSGLVEVAVIGSAGVDTGVTAGPNPYLEDKIKELQQAMVDKKAEVKQIMATIFRLTLTEKRKNDDPELMGLRQKLPEIEFDIQKVYAWLMRLAQYKAELKNAMVVVYEVVHEGSIIVFGDFDYMIEEEESNIAFKAGKYGITRQSLDAMGEDPEEEDGNEDA